MYGNAEESKTVFVNLALGLYWAVLYNDWRRCGCSSQPHKSPGSATGSWQLFANDDVESRDKTTAVVRRRNASAKRRS